MSMMANKTTRQVDKADLDHFLSWLDESTSTHQRRMFRGAFGPKWRQLLLGPRLVGLVRLPYPEAFDGWGLVLADRRGRLWAHTTTVLTDRWRVGSAKKGIEDILSREIWAHWELGETWDLGGEG